VIVNALDMKDRVPVSHPLRKKTCPVLPSWPAWWPGDMNEGYQPSNEFPLLSVVLQGDATGPSEPVMGCGVVQFCCSRLLAVE
jgi:hypothetical protein